MCTSCRRSSMRKWRNCTFLHLARNSPSLLRNLQITMASRLKALSKVGTTRVLSLAACSMHTSQYSDGENRRGSGSGRTLRGSSSSAGRPLHESSIAKNNFEIELDREEKFANELDMDKRVLPGQRKSPKSQSPETELERLPERTTRLPIFHKSWREDRSCKESATNQAPSSSTGSAFRFTVWQTRISDQQCCLKFN